MRPILKLGLGLFLFALTAAPSNAAAIADSVEIQGVGDSLLVCTGTSVNLAATGGFGYTWSPAADFDEPESSTPTLTPSASQWYYVTGTVGDTTCTDSVYVTLIDPAFEVSVSTSDTICPGDEVVVSIESSHPISAIIWTPDTEVMDPGSTNGTVITPLETTEYVVEATIGNCTRSDTFTINVVDFSLRNITPDTIFLCLPDTANILYELQPLDATYTWTTEDTTFMPNPDFTRARVFPEVSTSYTITAEYDGCTLTHTTFVRVDSLPNLDLVVIPFKEQYCAGEEVIIFAEEADSAKYPDIMFSWMPMDGQILDSTNTGNVYIITRDTTTFVRAVRNNACVDSSDITLNVVPPAIPLSVEDTTLCPGDMFEVEVLDREVQDLEWMPTDGLACDDCFDQVVTVQEVEQMYTVQGMKDGCPVGATLNVGVHPPLTVQITPSAVDACIGDQIAFTIDTTGLTNLAVTVSGSSTVSCINCPDPVVTVGSGGTLTVVAEENLDEFCGAFGQAVISIRPFEPASEGPLIVCADEPTILDLSVYGFENPMLRINNGSLSCNDCLDPEVTISQTTTLIVESDNENPDFCGLETSITLLIPEEDEVTFTLSEEEPAQGQTVDITLNTTPFPSPGSIFNWEVNDMPVQATTQTVTVPLNQSENLVKVTWTNSSGCMQMADTTIATVPPNHTIPKAFTPNGDDTNETFRPKIEGNIDLMEMLIFNRWGELVYEGSDPDGWDGTYNGKAAPPEVYVYLITLQYPDRTVKEKGDVTLIR